MRVLDALQITPLLSFPPTLSWDVEIAKPAPGIYQKACEACGEEEAGEGVIMVGDELQVCVASYFHFSSSEMRQGLSWCGWSWARSETFEEGIGVVGWCGSR